MPCISAEWLSAWSEFGGAVGATLAFWLAVLVYRGSVNDARAAQARLIDAWVDADTARPIPFDLQDDARLPDIALTDLDGKPVPFRAMGTLERGRRAPWALTRIHLTNASGMTVSDLSVAAKGRDVGERHLLGSRIHIPPRCRATCEVAVPKPMQVHGRDRIHRCLSPPMETHAWGPGGANPKMAPASRNQPHYRISPGFGSGSRFRFGRAAAASLCVLTLWHGTHAAAA
jgi:hypothetical protein